MRALVLTLTIFATADAFACSVLHSLVGGTISASEIVDGDKLERFFKGEEKTLILRNGMTLALPRGTVRHPGRLHFSINETLYVIAYADQRFQLLISDELHDVELVGGRAQNVKAKKTKRR